MMATLFLGTSCSDMEEAINERIVSTQTEEETPQKETANEQQTKAEYVYSNVITIELQEEGTLGQVLTGDSLNADKLIISGKIDASDFSVIQGMKNLLALDMTDVTFVQNSTTYKSKNNSNTYSLKKGIINEYMFYDWSNITEIKLPKSIQEIGRGAFEYCHKLSNIEIPSAKSIGNSAFYYNSSLSKVTLPDNLETIGQEAFEDCDALTTLEIPSAKSINDEAFRGCDKLAKLALPENLETIGQEAFYSCAQLENFKIPESVTHIGQGAFSGCLYKLTAIEIPKGIRELPASTFSNCNKLSSVVLPDSLKTIGASAFYNTDIKNLDFLPDSLQSLGEYAFARSSLTSAKLPRLNGIIPNNLFDECQSLASVTLPENIHTINARAFSNCPLLKSIELPDNLKELGEGVFQNTGLQSIEIPTQITTINSSMFYGCGSLQTVKLPETVTSIGNDAFHGCTALTSITLPNSVTSIGNYAFMDCTALTSITLPNSVTSIGNDTFYRCTALSSITLPNSVTSIGNDTFGYCTALTSITLPNSVTSIGEYTFYGCTALTSITLSESLESIGNRAFYQCEKLGYTKFPASLKTIGSDAFAECYAMTLDAQLPEGITSIGSGAFNNCDALTELIFPSTLATVPSYCCNDCSNLASVTLSEGISSIDSHAFYKCGKLTENGIHLPGSLTKIDEYSFAETGITTIDFLPEGLKSIYGHAFHNSNLNGVLKFPSTVTYLADYALYDNDITAIYLPSKESITVGKIFGPSRKSNCLIYTNSENCNTSYNVVVNGVCVSLQLVETASFHCPEAFVAGQVTFVKQFNQGNQYLYNGSYTHNLYAPKGEASHWYGLSLPFEVTEISTSDGRNFAPFNAGVEGAKPFWLRRMTVDGSWENMTKIEAGEPYIIAFPCSESYDDQFNVWGEVTFKGKRVQIPATEEYAINHGFYAMKRNYAVLSQSQTRLMLNSPRWGDNNVNNPQGERGNSSYNWGSRFISNLRPSWAFEAYIGAGAGTTTSLSIGSESNTRSSKTLGSVPSIDDM